MFKFPTSAQNLVAANREIGSGSFFGEGEIEMKGGVIIWNAHGSNKYPGGLSDCNLPRTISAHFLTFSPRVGTTRTDGAASRDGRTVTGS